MSTVDTRNNSSGANAAAGNSNASALSTIKPEDFLKMLITELQNQDPMNPTDNAQLLQQISEISNIQATSTLTQSLNALLTEQNLSAASSLVGKTIEGLADDGSTASGKVDSVTIADGSAKLNIGQQTVSLANIKQITSG
jgi:flagellar basal-body rod modification protein FlgD